VTLRRNNAKKCNSHKQTEKFGVPLQFQNADSARLIFWLPLLTIALFVIMFDIKNANAESIIRLDPDVVPLHYTLDLTIDPRSQDFRGVVSIDLKLATAKPLIILHAAGLVFDSIDVNDDARSQKAEAVPLAADGTIRLDYKHAVGPGPVKLDFHYHATYSGGLEGFYKVTDEGISSVFTQFQAIGARRAFPCFDEPGFKARFDITMRVPKKLAAISNTREIGTTVAGRKLLAHHFATTKPLPTYLIAMAVGDFDIVTAKSIPKSDVRAHTIPLRGVAVRGKGDELRLALEATAPLVLAEEKYFGIAYPFDKLDIIAAPDMGAGGMENAGAIVYDESLALLSDDATLQRRRAFLTTHAHEIAHQWFGNLVTPRWWDDLWLNESFATLMETKFASQIEPHWRFETDILSNAHEAMMLDGAVSVRRVREPVTTVDGISAAFDAITYQKGAAILAMVEHAVGADVFQSFVHRFLSDGAFGVMDSRDFTSALEQLKDGKAAARMLTSFIDTPGLPIVKVRRNASMVNIQQSAYRPLGGEAGAVSSPPWVISLCHSSIDGAHRQCHTFDNSHSSFSEEGLSAYEILSVDGIAGYYAFDVSQSDWLGIVAAVPKMPRAQALAVAISFDVGLAEGRIPLTTYLVGVGTIARHPDWEVAGFPVDRLAFLASELPSNSKANREVLEQINKTYGPRLAAIGLTKSLEGADVETWLLELQREHLSDLFATTGANPVLQAKLADLGDAIIKEKDVALDDSEIVPPDIVEAALVSASQRSGEVFLRQAIERLRMTSDAHEREIWVQAIASNRAASSGHEIEKLLLSDVLRNQEVPILLSSRAAVPAFRDETWNLVDRHATELLHRLNGDLEISLIQIADEFTTQQLAKRVEVTITPHLGQLRGGTVQLGQTLELIRHHAALLAELNREQ
jgi:cytosol alanyl aminopeptidase